MISGAAYVVKALQEENVEFLFNYPGAATIDIMDELYKQDQVKVILPRHEQALAHAADGYARSTGKVGVCMVTSGPGATNLVTGIATAYSDSVPMVCITGQVDLSLMGNDAFQEVDTVGIVRNVSKYAVTVRDRKDLGRILKEAFYIARTGRPGPVLVDIPKNIQKAMGSDVYPSEVNIRGYKPNTTVHIGQVKKACSVIAKAKRPLFLLGGGISISGANELMTQLVDKTGIPVVTTLMGKGAISSRHPLYLGNVGIHGGYAPNVAITDCDVMISIGTRFNDRITGKLSTFAQNCKIVHIDVDAASIFIFTAKVEDMDKIMGLTVGADDYITKPFNPLELMARVKTQLRRYTRYNTAGVTQEQDEEIDIRGMHISNISHKCMLNGQEIALTPLEFDIVWYLARKQGKVVSSEELFEAVWKEKYLDNNNTVMAHIARIRDKMHETARKPKFIKTVWGVGYTIE